MGWVKKEGLLHFVNACGRLVKIRLGGVAGRLQNGAMRNEQQWRVHPIYPFDPHKILRIVRIMRKAIVGYILQTPYGPAAPR